MTRVADQLRKKNIAEYLIYMWQVEDLIRANDCDINKIKKNVVSKFKIEDKEKGELTEWYDNLVQMMYKEGITEKGHLQINKNILLELAELHGNLLSTTQFPYYQATYYKTLPYIVELRSKNNNKLQESELEVCFEALYGILLLRLQKKTITPQTEKAIGTISNFLSMLANFYNKEKNNEIEW